MYKRQVLTNEPSGNTYSGSSRTNSRNEKTGRFAAPPKKKKRTPAAIRVLIILCLCFASLFGCLLLYSTHLKQQPVSTPETGSAPETANRMRSDSDTPCVQVFHSGIYRYDVGSVTFLDTTADAPEDAWDISEKENGSVLAWVTGQAPAYDLYIAGRGGVRAPENCFGLFAGYANATSITFGTAFDTSEVTDMGSMFTLCVKLTNLDVHNFDTSHVTDMHYMFSGCYSLTDLDLSSFDFSNVENYGGFMDNGRLYNGQPWEELFPNGSSNSSFRSQPTLAAGAYHTVGLCNDGTVVATEWNGYGQCNVNSWTDIVAVAAGYEHTVGLRSDGTVVATGQNDEGQCDVDSWSNIVVVAAGDYLTVGLRSDGTAVATGWNQYGQCDVDSWTDIIAVDAGWGHTVGLRSDGTVVATGWNDYGQCDVDSWTDIVAVTAGSAHTVGLRSDGTVVAAGWNQSDFDSWTDIVAIATGDNHAVGLRSDGTVIATGQNDVGQCNVGSWTDIVAVAAGWGYTVGLRSDGTVVATGQNDVGQCNVSNWKNIRLPQK